MFKLIGAILKYSLLVLTILVLSHVIEIQGVTISQHVLRAMHAMTGYSPQNQAVKITESFKASVQEHVNELNRVDAEVSGADQKALNQVIERAQSKKK